jgi:hypothetical protein
MKSKAKDLEAGKGCCVCNCFHGPKCRRCSCVGVVTVPFVFLAVLVVWVAFFLRTTQEVETLLCGFTTILTDLQYGVNVPGSAQFSGIKGLSYIMTNTETDMEKTRTGSDALSIVTKNSKAQGTTYSSSLGTYYDNWKASTVTSPLDGTTNIMPDLITDMTSKINAAISTESTSIVSIATNQTDGATVIYGLSAAFPTTWNKFKGGIGKFFSFKPKF